MFKDQIASALKTKYQRFGLSNEAVDRIASAREKTVTADEDIESVVADVETMNLIANELQRSADVERRNRSNLQKSFDEYKEKHPDAQQDQPQQQPQREEEPEWAKKLREQNEMILKRQQDEDAARMLKENRDAVEGRLKAAGCTNPGILKGVLKGFALMKDESVDAAVTRLQGEYNTTYKEAFGDGPLPGVGGQAFGDAKTAVDKKNAFLVEQGLLPKQEK